MALLDRPDFTVSSDRAADRAVVHVVGELDAATAPMLRAHVAALVDREAPPTLVLDLARMSFIDSTGVGALLGALHLVRRHGGELVLHAPSHATVRVLEVTGLATTFTVTCP